MVKQDRPQIPKSSPNLLATIIKSCWNAEPCRRLQAKELLEKLRDGLATSVVRETCTDSTNEHQCYSGLLLRMKSGIRSRSQRASSNSQETECTNSANGSVSGALFDSVQDFLSSHAMDLDSTRLNFSETSRYVDYHALRTM